MSVSVNILICRYYCELCSKFIHRRAEYAGAELSLEIIKFMLFLRVRESYKHITKNNKHTLQLLTSWRCPLPHNENKVLY